MTTAPAYWLLQGFVAVGSPCARAFCLYLGSLVVLMMGVGALVSLLLGLVGGLLPAVRAARIPVASALREL